MLIQTDALQAHDLGFCTITLLSEHLAEVIVNAGVHMTLDMVEHYHTFLLTHLRAPICLLINKVHPYSYNFEAQRTLATIPEIQAMAVVSYSRLTDVATQALVELPREVQWNLKTFSDRDAALAWLSSLQASELRQIR